MIMEKKTIWDHSSIRKGMIWLFLSKKGKTMNQDQDRYVSEEEIKAKLSIERLNSVKRFFSSKAVFCIAFLVCYILLIIIAVSVEHSALMFSLLIPLLWGIMFIGMNVLAFTQKRIKRLEDFVLTGVSTEKDKPDKDVLIRELFGWLYFIGLIFLFCNISVSMIYIPEWFILPFGFLAIVGMLIFGAEGMMLIMSVILLAVDLKSGNPPWQLYFLPGAGILLTAGTFLFSYMLDKKVDRRFDAEADSTIRPALESVMTVEKFRCREILPYYDQNAKNIEGNCYAVGKWKGIAVSFSNLSFKSTVVRDNKQLFNGGLVNGTKSFCGIGVTYIIGHKPNEKELDTIRYNLQQYKLYDISINSANKITALLDVGYFFTLDKSFNAVCHGSRPEIDAKKLDGIFERIQAGVHQKEIPPQLPLFSDGRERD